MQTELRSRIGKLPSAWPVAIARLFVLLLLPGILLAQDKNAVSETGQDHFDAPFPSQGSLRMFLRSSGVRITGSDDNKIAIRFFTHDLDGVKDVRVKLKQDGNRGDLDITGGPSNNFQMEIQIPRQCNLYVRMFAGQLEIEHVDGNKDLQIHAGQMDITLPHAEDYGPVEASVTSGDLEASAFGVSKGGLFRSFHTNTALHKNTAGKYSLYAHVGAGELDIN